MLRLGRWKSGFAFLLLLHLLVHPALHVQPFPELLAGSTQPNFTQQNASDPYDVCSLCRVAKALHVPAPVPVQERLPLQLCDRRTETSPALRAAERSQQIPRAPPLPA
jgi:hypothetical protein